MFIPFIVFFEAASPFGDCQK